MWQTEYCDLNDNWNPDWDGINKGDGYRWAFILHKALTTGNINAYYWYVTNLQASKILLTPSLSNIMC